MAAIRQCLPGGGLAPTEGLFDETLVERAEPAAGEDPADANAGVNMRFRAFDPNAVMLVPPSLDEWLPQNCLARFHRRDRHQGTGPVPVL